MFRHPYAHAEHFSEESTRRNTARNADMSSGFSGRVNRERVGATGESMLSSRAHPPQDNQPPSLTQSLFSAMGNLFMGASNTSSKQVNTV